MPIYFDGQNSRLFQILSRLSQTLRTALFLHEVTRMIGARIGVVIGDPIPFSDLAGYSTRAALCAELRRRTYALGGIAAPGAAAAYRMTVPAGA